MIDISIDYSITALKTIALQSLARRTIEKRRKPERVAYLQSRQEFHKTGNYISVKENYIRFFICEKKDFFVYLILTFLVCLIYLLARVRVLSCEIRMYVF